MSEQLLNNETPDIDTSKMVCDKPTLEALVIDNGMSPQQVSDFFGEDEDGYIRFTKDEVLAKLREYNISPSFIKGINIVESIQDDILEYEMTIAKYSKDSQAKYRKLDKIIKKLDAIRNAQKYTDNESLKGMLENVINSGLTFKELISIQQQDEKIRIDFFKLKQASIQAMMKAIEIQTNALEAESLMTSIYEELYKIDEENQTNFAESFLINTQKRAMEKISHNKMLNKVTIADPKKRLMKMIEEAKAKRGMSPKELKKQAIIRGMIKEHNIHYMTAQLLLSLYYKKYKKKKPMNECLAEAKADAARIYRYIGEDGRIKEKAELKKEE